MGITVTATSIQPKDITISETGEKVTVTDSTATVSNIIKDTLTLTLAGANTNIGDLANVEITSVADGQLLVYETSSGKWKNAASSSGVTSVNSKTGAVTLVTDDIAEDGAPTNRYFTDARARGVVSATDAGGDGSFAYDSGTGVFTYTGPTASETRAHFTAGAGLTLASGEYSIGNDAIKDTMIDFGTGATQVSTADIPEQTNLYYTDTRVQTKIDANSAGFITASSTETLTNKSGNISMFTNDAGYLTSETDSQTLSFSSPNLSISGGNSVDISGITSGYLQNVSEDSTPQLGGDLDMNGNDIVTTSNADIDLDPNGNGVVVFKGNSTKGAGQFKLNCEQNSHGITIKGPPHSAAASYTLTLPNTDGNADQVLKTDGSGNLDWTAGGLANVVEDTTPQLGGNLDAQSNQITAVSKLEITNTSTDDSLLITTTEDSATAGPVLTFKRNSGSPADSDYLGQIKFKGENDADQEVVYAKMTGKISDASDTTEDGLLEFALRKAGSNNIGMRLTSTELKLLNSTKLDMGSQPIENVTDPSSAQDAATKAYVDANAGISDVVSDTTPQLGGDLDVNSQSIVSTSNGNIVLDPNGTGAVTVEGDSTTPGNFGERLTRLRNAPLIIDNNQSNAWWGSQMIMKDNSDDIFAMVGREDTSGKVYGYIITMDPNGTHTNSSSYAGDYGFYFNMQYEGGSGNDEWYMIHNVFGADDGYFINAYGSGHNSYAYTPLKLRGSVVEISADTGGLYGGGTQGPAFKVQTDHVDLNGLKIKDTTGALTLNDNVTVNLDSAGTTAMVTENESATASGNRITVGKSDTAHTGGTGFEVRRGTGSGFETQFKVETASSRSRTTVTSAFNLVPVAYADLHGSPSKGDLQFLITDGAGATKNAPIYYDGSNWKYFNDNSTVAAS